MLSRLHRFHGHTSLSYVYRQGSTVRGPHLALRYIRNSRSQMFRVAVIVSRKIHKSAVKRNQVRRRIYEVVRTGSAITEPFDLVFTVYSEEVLAMEPAELTSQVISLLHKAKVYDQASSVPRPHAIVEVREENHRKP